MVELENPETLEDSGNSEIVVRISRNRKQWQKLNIFSQVLIDSKFEELHS